MEGEREHPATKTNRLTRPIQLHRAGKTEEAKSDLARLKKIKEEREAAQTKRKAEAEGLYLYPPILYMGIKGTLLCIVKAAEARKKAAMSGKRI